MISKKVQDPLNKQLNSELYSAYLYMSMSAWFESSNLKGFANWMRVQVQEEMVHVQKFHDFIIQRGGKVILSAVDGPPTVWTSPLKVFEDGLKHEQLVTSRINDLIDLGTKEKDHATVNFLQWFVTEQVEEESSFNDVLQRLKIIGKDGGALFMLDKELSLRVFTPPAPAAGQ